MTDKSDGFGEDNGKSTCDLRDADFEGASGGADSVATDSSITDSTDALGDMKATKPSQLAILEQQVADHKDKYIRSVADFENFKRRTQKERSDLIRYQGERILVDMLDVLDNLERALEHSSANGAAEVKLREGVELIHKQFLGVLSKWDVRAEPGVGKQFDPNKFQAIGQAASPDAAPGTIIAEVKKAYFYKDKLLRVGDVIVAQSASEATSAADTQE